MSLLVAPFLLLTALPTSYEAVRASDAPSIITSFVAIKRPLEFVGVCSELDPNLVLNDEYEHLDGRLLSAEVDAKGVWPSIDFYEVARLAIADGPPWPNCRREHVESALHEARIAFDFHSQLFRKLTTAMQMPSAWAGPLRLCRGSVERAEFTSDYLSNQPALALTLAPDLKGAWSEITEQSIGQQFPIRLDGTVILRPVVNERIDSGEFQVTGPDHDTLVRMAERVVEPC